MKNELQSKLNELMMRNKDWLKDHFNLEYPEKIVVNSRLTRSLGRFKVENPNSLYNQKLSIDISSSLFTHYTEDEQDDVFRHELIHYSLYCKGQPYRDSDNYFKNVCRHLGVTLSGHYKTRDYKHIYVCGCREHKRNRRITRFVDNRSHTCKICKEYLKYKGKVS